MDGQKQIVLPIIGTTAKKQYKDYSIINYKATNKFINTQFIRKYNLLTLPLTKAHTLQLTNSSYTIQKITYMAQLYLNINRH